ncbi:MAG: hypothetical protein ABSG55_01140 [Dehalococcoidia bacterium]|jgi:hypothetical protein
MRSATSYTGLAALTTLVAWLSCTSCALAPGSATDPPLGLLFGLGPEAHAAQSSPLNQQAPLGMYTTWYNGPSDLSWMSNWREAFVPSVYASGKALHIIVAASGGPETGVPCGRQYPISAGIDIDMVQLAHIFAGTATDPPLYVTLFTEFQTYPCVDNQWKGAEDYYAALQAKMLRIKDIFHQYAPNSKVSIGWGGWQSRWDDPTNGGGRSLFPYFANVMSQMDFQSFQAMQDDGNVNDVRGMSKALGAYGPVMLAHYKPNSGSTTTYSADLTAMMTDDFLREVTGYGLFAWSFMDTAQMSSDPSIFTLVKDALLRYGHLPATPVGGEAEPPPSTPDVLASKGGGSTLNARSLVGFAAGGSILLAVGWYAGRHWRSG